MLEFELAATAFFGDAVENPPTLGDHDGALY
jgi:hypothetical protein